MMQPHDRLGTSTDRLSYTRVRIRYTMLPMPCPIELAITLASKALMPRPSDDRIIESIRLYRESLKETQALYIESGELVRGSYGWLTGGDDADAASIAGQMDDLHQGFLMKVFASVVPSVQGTNDGAASTRPRVAGAHLGKIGAGQPIARGGRLVDRCVRTIFSGVIWFGPLPRCRRSEIAGESWKRWRCEWRICWPRSTATSAWRTTRTSSRCSDSSTECRATHPSTWRAKSTPTTPATR